MGRKIVNRIKDSDVETSQDPNDTDSEGDETNKREKKLKYLVTQFPKIDAIRNANWNSEEAEEALRYNRKRTLDASVRTSKKKRRKSNRDEVDVDLDEAHYKQKVYDRFLG